MGSTHFQMKTLKNVRTEMALHVLAYNTKRVMMILGVGGLIEAIRAQKRLTRPYFTRTLRHKKPIPRTVDPDASGIQPSKPIRKTCP